LRLVLLEQLLEPLAYLLAVRRALHVDEVEHDEAAEVAEPELVGDFLDRLEVRLVERVLEVLRAFADVATGVDVDRRESLGLIDDEIAARGERNLARERTADLIFDAVRVEDGLVAGVKDDVLHALGHEHLDEPNEALVLLAVVDDDLLDVVGEEIARRL